MAQILFLLAIVAIIAFLLKFRGINIGGDSTRKQWGYQYKKRNFFLSRAEHECYDALILAAGNDYYIFAQVHLPSIVDNKVVGQNWQAAFRHIGGKSVDFVLCDKAYISPKLAIELDDKTHERPERQERDKEVERILKEAGVPLLRLENHGRFSPDELSRKIRDAQI